MDFFFIVPEKFKKLSVFFLVPPYEEVLPSNEEIVLANFCFAFCGASAGLTPSDCSSNTYGSAAVLLIFEAAKDFRFPK